MAFISTNSCLSRLSYFVLLCLAQIAEIWSMMREKKKEGKNMILDAKIAANILRLAGTHASNRMISDFFSSISQS